MDITFKEKSTWIHLITTLLIFGFYFTKAIYKFINATIEETNLIGLFIAVVISMIIIEVISHIILSIVYRKQSIKEEDERDNLIQSKATKTSYYILVIGVWITSMSILNISSPFLMANIIMFFFILAEIIGMSIQLYYYRKGI